MTVAEQAGRTALRTKDDEFSATWAEYGERVRAVAGGLAAARGRGAATRSGSCSPTGPSSISPTPRRCTSARRRSPSTTPRPRSRSSTWLPTPPTRVLVTEQAFLDTALAVRDAAAGLEHVVVVDGEPRDGRDLARRAGSRRRAGLRLRGRLAGGPARGPGDADLHLRHDRAAEGRAADPRQRARRRSAPSTRSSACPATAARGLLAADGPHRRAQRHPLRADRLRHHHDLLPRPAPGRRLPGRSPADLVLRRAAGLGKTEGGDGDRDRRRGRRQPPPGGRVGAGGRPADGRRRAGRRGALARARRRTREGRGDGARLAARAGRLRPAALGARRRRPLPAGDDRVLPRDRAARWPSSGGSPRAPAPAPATRPSGSRSGPSARPRPGPS